MNYLTIDELQERLKPMGRTLTDPQSGVLYFDWTLIGVEILFRGCTLLADLCALPGTEANRSPPDRADYRTPHLALVCRHPGRGRSPRPHFCGGGGSLHPAVAPQRGRGTAPHPANQTH